MNLKIQQSDPSEPVDARVHTALQNVRTLVDELQNDERKRRKVAILGLVLFLPVVVLLAVQAIRSGEDPARVAQDKTRPCILDYWAQKSGELERSMRSSGIPNDQIQKKIELERPFIMANAKSECDATPGK